MDRALDAVLARPRHHLLRLVAGLHRPQAHLAEQRDAGVGQVLEVLLDHAFLDHWRAGQYLHAAGAEVVEGALCGDGQRLETHDVLRAAGQVHLTGGDHRRHAAVHRRIDPAELVLPRRPVAEHRVHVAVHEAGCDAGLARIDGDLRAGRVAIGLLADGDDQAVVDDESIGLEDRVVDVSRQQEADVLDDDLARRCICSQLCHGLTPCCVTPRAARCR